MAISRTAFFARRPAEVRLGPEAVAKVVPSKTPNRATKASKASSKKSASSRRSILRAFLRL